MTDQEIIENIRSGNREPVLRFLYAELPKIQALIRKSGFSEHLAGEIFNDSLIIFIEKVEKPDFQLTAKATTFLYGINRFLLMNELRKRQHSPELEWKDTLIVSAEDLGYDEEKEEKLKLMEAIISKVSERCQKIFKLFYYKKESMDSIAKQLGFSSTNSAKTQKYKCLQRAHQLAQESYNTEAL